jgi:hypothetical protein
MVHSPSSASWRAKRGANLRPIAPSPRRRLPSWRSAAWSPLPRARVTGLVPAYSLRADAGVAARVVAAHRAPEHSSTHAPWTQLAPLHALTTLRALTGRPAPSG